MSSLIDRFEMSSSHCSAGVVGTEKFWKFIFGTLWIFERGRLQYNPSRANAAFFEQIFSVEGRSRRGPLDPGGPLDHGGPLGPRLDSLDSRHGDSLESSVDWDP